MGNTLYFTNWRTVFLFEDDNDEANSLQGIPSDMEGSSGRGHPFEKPFSIAFLTYHD